MYVYKGWLYYLNVYSKLSTVHSFGLLPYRLNFRQVEQMNGALINGLEARVSKIEDKLEDLDARTSEEADNALNEREMDRFIMSGNLFCLSDSVWFYIL